MSSEESSPQKMFVLKSFDGQLFEVEEAVAVQSDTIKHLIEDVSANNSIPLPNIDSKILAKVIEYCKRHAEANNATAGADNKKNDLVLKDLDAAFVNVDQSTLYDLILAANYLSIKSLLDLTCQKVADMIKGKTPEQIRELLNIENDFTPEEEAEIRRENKWAFE